MSRHEQAAAIWIAKQVGLTLAALAFGAMFSLWLWLAIPAVLYTGNRLNNASRRRALPRRIEQLERELGIIPATTNATTKLPAKPLPFRARRRCWWSWPLGHDYREPKKNHRYYPHRICKRCGDIEVTDPH